MALKAINSHFVSKTKGIFLREFPKCLPKNEQTLETDLVIFVRKLATGQKSIGRRGDKNELAGVAPSLQAFKIEPGRPEAINQF